MNYFLNKINTYFLFVFEIERKYFLIQINNITSINAKL